MKTKRNCLLFFVLILLSSSAFSSSESSLKAGILLNKGNEEIFSWLLIHGTDYFIHDTISIGYETQFSYYKIDPINSSSILQSNAYSLNVFFNSKVKIFQKGIFRPYGIFGLGLLTNINYHPGENTFEKFPAFHIGSGINIGKSGGAGLQIELRLMRSNQEGSKIKFLLVCGIEY